MSLLEEIELIVEDLDGVATRESDEGADWSVRGVVFAAAAGDVVELRLDPLIGRAALGTPDTAASRRGPDWISFTPRVLDGFALDRLDAWLGSAHRNATRPSPSRRPAG